MTEPIAPLTPADCDLRDFAFMPLDVVRLRDSDLAATETSEVFRAAVMLWCASWHQVPAASLPDDDRVLANLAGYGRVVKAWLAERPGAMRGWMKCADGRLYHPVVAEKAIEAWKGKLERQWRTECARIKKHNQRHNLTLEPMELDEWLKAGRPQGHQLPVPEDTDKMSPGTKAGRPDSVLGETASKGQGEGQGQGQLKNPSGSTPSKSARKPKGSKRVPADFEVTPEMVAWAAEQAPLVDWQRETLKFRNWEFKHARTDWPATWRTWLLKAQESAEIAASAGRGPRGGGNDWTAGAH